MADDDGWMDGGSSMNNCHRPDQPANDNVEPCVYVLRRVSFAARMGHTPLSHNSYPSQEQVVAMVEVTTQPVIATHLLWCVTIK